MTDTLKPDYNQVACLRSEKFNIIVTTQKYRSKVMKIIFSKRDGSLYVTFPYFKHSKGIVCQATLRATNEVSSSINLQEDGKTTSHLVKYTHHPDGLALFTQDGKVLSQIRKTSTPIGQIDGHIFTAYFQGLHEYTPAKDKDLHARPDTGLVKADFPDAEPTAIKIVGRWYSLAGYLSRRKEGPKRDPVVRVQAGNGVIQDAILISAPIAYPFSDRLLVLTCEGIKPLSEDDSLLLFLGGFDERSRVEDLTAETTFLCLLYPANNFDQLRQTIGSIDFFPLGKSGAYPY